MTRYLLLAFLLIPRLATSQAGSPKAFEVASITPSKPGTPAPPGEHAGIVEFTQPGGRFDAKAITAKALLEWAYDLQPARHSDGPAWFGSDRYDIIAKAGSNASDDEMKLMARALLAERFHMQSHIEKRTISALILTAGKGSPNLTRPKEGEVRGMRGAPQMGPDQKLASYSVMLTRFTMTQLADAFSRQLGQVIVDRTGLDGDFDIRLELTPDETGASPLDAGHMITALRDQLGLNLKSEKTPVDFLVVDSIEKVAAGNQEAH